MIRYLFGKFWLLCAGLIILSAVLLTVARLVMPHADRYQDEIAGWLGEAIGQPVTVGSVVAEWRGLGPRLLLGDVVLGDAAAPVARFASVAVDLDVPSSILRGQPSINRLVVTGVRFTIERDAGGVLSIAGQGLPGIAPGEGVPGGAPSPLLRWMFDQGRLAIESAVITWIDHRAGGGDGLVFTGVNLQLRNMPGRHQIDGSVRLPDALGMRITVAAEVFGDPLGTDWRAMVHARGDGLMLDEWLAGRDEAGILVDGGAADLALWLDLRDRRIERVEGRIAATALALHPAPPAIADGAPARQAQENGDAPDGTSVAPAAGQVADPLRIDAFGGDFAWRPQAAGWRLDVRRLRFEAGGDTDVDGLLAVDWRAADGGDRTLHVRAAQLPIGEITALLAASRLTPPALAGALAGSSPDGLLTDLDFHLVDAGGDERRFAARGGIESFHGEPWSRVPGARNLGGRFAFDQDSGYIDLDAGDGELDFGDLFREPLPFAVARGRVEWARLAGGWRLRAPRIEVGNEDLDLVAWGRLDLPPDGGMPEIALFARFDAHTVERTSRYLPVRIMPPATVRWLDRAILGGRSPRGELVFHGPLRGFPFDGGTGRFKVDFDLEDGVLEYSPGWPAIEGIAAHVVFEGRGMAITARDGTSLSSRILSAEAGIGNLTGKPAVLEVRGRAQGKTIDALRYLRETPLAERFGALARDADAAGSSELDLRLEIALDGSPAGVDGVLDLADSTLMLADDTIDITQINGRLGFTERGLSADGIDAVILGLPAFVTVAPRLEDGAPGALVQAVGRARGPAIAELLDLAPLRHLEGETAWHARLRVPFGDDGAMPGTELLIESALVGLALDLPEPLAKPADRALPLTIRIPLPREPDLPVHFALADRLAGTFTLGEANRIVRGELRFGGGDAVLPEFPGLRLSGATDQLDYNAWAAVFDDGGSDDSAGAARGLVNEADLQIGRARVFDREFDDLRLRARRDANAWLLEVDGAQIAGRIVIPHEDGRQWRADLQRLQLAATGDGEGRSSGRVVDPRTLPPMRVESERFRYGDTDFGSLSLLWSRRPAGIHMDRLLLSSERTRIDARGDWVVAGERQFSSFNIDFTTGDFGSALANFGYADAIRGGKGNAVVAARWRGPPTEFALERLDGSIELSITDGRLLDVEPGAGRIFGLVSLQALPRRLTLDFSDFFARGFSFDRIDGNFVIRDGVATTTDLVMDGPAAKVEASGKVDLAAREYDQQVVVTPNVTSGLPVAGAVAGGVGLGAAILLMERIFRPDIDRITRITYQVSGPWSDPVVQRLQGGAQSGKR